MGWTQVKDANWKVPYTAGWCLKYVREAFGIGPKYPTAIDAWKNATSKHYDYPPAGITVPVFFSIKTEPAGHIAIRLDDMCVASSTQAGTHPQGYIHKNIESMMLVYGSARGNCTYLGWTEDLNGVTVIRWEPEITHKTVTTTEVIPFETVTQEDNTIPVGETHVANEGTDGVQTIVTKFTYSDGKEIKQEVVSDSVTTGVINKSVLVGTKQPEPVVPPTPEPVTPPAIDNSFIIKAIRFIIRLIKLIIGVK